MKDRWVVWAVCCSLVVLLPGCVHRVADFTALSTKNVNAHIPPGSQRYTGQDCRFIVFGWPLGYPNVKEAMDRVMEQAGADYDAIMDGVVEFYSFNLILFGQQCFNLEGTPVRSEEAFRTSAVWAPPLLTPWQQNG